MENSNSNAEQQQTTYNNEMRGVLFKNDKGGNDKRPDYRGRCTIHGQQYRISGWSRTAVQSGQPFISFAFTPEQLQQTQTSIPVEAADFTPKEQESDEPSVF